MPEFDYPWNIAEWSKVAVKQTWPQGVKDYGDVPYLVDLNDRFIDLSNEIDIDTENIIASIFIDMFHLLCMRDVVKTYKSVHAMARSIEKDVMKQVLKQVRDALTNSLDSEDV